MADSSYESVLLVKNEVFVYKIPPRPSNRGYRAAEWKLDSPDWTGRLRVVALNKDLFIKLEDKDGGLFAQCPVEDYPGVAVESVMDSSRYFVIRIKDESGRSAFIGIGFADRSDSFDLNVSLQDHFKWLKQEKEAAKATQELLQGPSLDLGFKAGQTITLNIGTMRGGEAAARPKPKPRTTAGFLPPPPGSGSVVKIPPMPAGGGGGGIVPPPSVGSSSDFVSAAPSNPAPQTSSANSGPANVDLLMGLQGPSEWSGVAPLVAPAPSQEQQSAGDVWGDFTSAATSSNTQAEFSSSNSSSSSGWVQF